MAYVKMGHEGQDKLVYCEKVFLYYPCTSERTDQAAFVIVIFVREFIDQLL